MPKVLFCTDLNLSNMDTLLCELALPGSSFGRTVALSRTALSKLKRLQQRSSTADRNVTDRDHVRIGSIIIDQ